MESEISNLITVIKFATHMPGRGADSGGRRLAAASTRTSPGAPAGSGSPATGCGWPACRPGPAAGSVGAARTANRVRGYHRILGENIRGNS